MISDDSRRLLRHNQRLLLTNAVDGGSVRWRERVSLERLQQKRGRYADAQHPATSADAS
jgi:hypothetical protein